MDNLDKEFNKLFEQFKGTETKRANETRKLFQSALNIEEHIINNKANQDVFLQPKKPIKAPKSIITIQTLNDYENEENQ